MTMTIQEHIKRHQELHRALDELLADFISHQRGPILETPIKTLVAWSHQQTIYPDEKED